MIDKTGCLQGTVGVQDPLTSLQSWRIWIGACGSDANFFNTFAVAPTAPSKVSIPVAMDNGSMGTRAVRKESDDLCLSFCICGDFQPTI